MGQACATAEGHCCNTRGRSNNPKRQLAQGSNCGCVVLAAVAAAAAAMELVCDRFSVEVEDLELSGREIL